MLLRLSDRRLVGLALLALAAGCGDSAASFPALPGTLVGESAHFRLFVSPEFPTQLSFLLTCRGALASTRSEADWADKQTMLKMPEGQRKIDYHLLTS